MIEYNLLELLYNNLDFQLAQKKKRKNASILMDFIKTTSNDRLKYLRESSDELLGADIAIINHLLEDNLIRENEFGKYYITANGIWHIESEKFNLIGEMKKFLDEEYFVNKKQDDPLRAREKIILLTLIAFRAFDLDNAIDLKSLDIIKDACGDTMEELNQLLLKLNVVKNSDYGKHGLFGKPSNEHKVSNVFRHSEDIPKKIKMLFVSHKKEQRYYLNISNEKFIIKKDLKFILSKILKDVHLSFNDIELLNDLHLNLSYKKGPNVYPNMSESFIQTKYDDIMVECIEEVLMGL